MPPIVILTDSAADIQPSLRDSLGIAMVPLKVNFGTETYLDGVTISPRAFYQKLTQSTDMPTTSQPSPLEFSEAFHDIVEVHGTDVQIIALTLSAALSGTHQSAQIAKSMMDDSLDITVIDSKKASFLYGLAAVEAARAVRAGQTKQQILDLIDRILADIQVYFLVDTLAFLQKGGRIGKASAVIGSLLNIKPILSLDPAGGVYAYDKIRGTKKAVARIFDELKSYAGNAPVKVVIAHADAAEEAEALRERASQEFMVAEFFIVELGAVIGTHTGPGTLAVMVVKA